MNYMNEQTKIKFFNCIGKDNVDELKKLHKKNPQLLLEIADGDNYPIHSCAKYNAIKCMKYILDTGFCPNCPTADYDPFYPLHVACMNGRYHIVNLLLEKGADPNLMCFNKTALLYAIKGRKNETTQLAIIKKLIEYGANPCTKGEYSKGAYGYEGLFDDVFTYITPINVAKGEMCKKIEQYLSQEVKKWKKQHSLIHRTLQFFCTFGQLRTKETNTNKPVTNHSPITTRGDGTLDYQKQIAQIINNLNQH